MNRALSFGVFALGEPIGDCCLSDVPLDRMRIGLGEGGLGLGEALLGQLAGAGEGIVNSGPFDGNLLGLSNGYIKKKKKEVRI